MSKRHRESEGIVKRHPDGFGFFISSDSEQPDVYIPRQAMKGIMSNDRVRVRVERERGGDRYRGEILEIITRAFTRVLGQYHAAGDGRGVLHDKSFSWGEDINVTCPAHLTPREGELVVVQIQDYPGSPRGFQGQVISVIGDVADPMNDSVRMLHAHGIPFEFSKGSLREAERLPSEVHPSEWADRRDLRAIPIITIDGKTAKDFDDAVFVETTPRGFHAIVAIADVSHYVKEGSEIDKDAVLRGTSTYFPGFVSPMLPEALSNELCSLKPNVPRLALVADMQIDFHGELLETELYEAVIKSAARVTYGEAQEMLDGQPLSQFSHVNNNIQRCANLARVLMNKRLREGSLDLDLPQTEIEIDESGLPTDIMQSERLFSHRLIEELMLIANVAVARFFKERGVEAIYRIHEEPRAEAMQNFASFLKAFGFRSKLSGGHLAKKMSQALEHFKGHPKEHILNMLALRSLMQAKYSPHNVGHFGLGFKDYTHFTSPIRRYPDLIVHRLIKSVLYPKKGYRRLSLEDLETLGTMTSACEQRSVKAERQIHSIKKARFMTTHLGQEFEGIISSVTKFGLFVLLRQFDVDGLLRVEELGGDRYDFDEERLRLVGRRSGQIFEIGDTITVQVAKTDIEMGQIDFVLPQEAANAMKAIRADSDDGGRPRRERGKGRAEDGPRANTRSRREERAEAYRAEKRARRERREAERAAGKTTGPEARREKSKDARQERPRGKRGSERQERTRDLGPRERSAKVERSKAERSKPERPKDLRAASTSPAAPAPGGRRESMRERILRGEFDGKSPEGQERLRDGDREDSALPVSKRGAGKKDSRGSSKSRVSRARRPR